jgi:hypothetical protein
MNKQDRKKLGILVVLIAVLALTILLGYQMNQPSSAAVAPAEQKASANPPAPSEAHIRLDLLENPEADQDIGSRNLFRYGPPPAPPPAPPMPKGNMASQPPPMINSAPAITPGPPKPPPPPPIPLRFQGYAVDDGLWRAFVADDVRNYTVTTGEILMGRYRIVSISDKALEVEDLEHNRRQTLPLLK